MGWEDRRSHTDQVAGAALDQGPKLGGGRGVFGEREHPGGCLVWDH